MEAEYGVYNENIEKFINFIKEENLEEMKKILDGGEVDLHKLYPDIPGNGGPCRCLAAHALFHRKYNSFVFLIQNGTDPNLYYKRSLLGFIIGGDHLRELNYLLENKADPNLKDRDGDTPLILSLNFHDTKNELRLLLEKGADPNMLVNGIHPLNYMFTKDGIHDKFIKTKILLEGGAVPTDMDFLNGFSQNKREVLEGLCYPRRKGAVKVLREEEEE